MQVVLEIDAATEAKVRELAARGERGEVMKLLSGPLEQAVDRLVPRGGQPRSAEEIERLLGELDDLAEETARELGSDHRPLPSEALTREGIYGDHP